MGHILFLFLHFLAIMFGLVGLVFTIPLHIIYAVIPKKSSWNSWKPSKQCPYCKKSIDESASKCPYCQEWIPKKNEEESEVPKKEKKNPSEEANKKSFKDIQSEYWNK